MCSDEFDVICITESWLNENILDSEIASPNYVVYRRDRDAVRSGKKDGGGVMVCVKKGLKSSSLANWNTNGKVEELWVSLTVNSEYAVPHSNGRRSVASMHYSRPCSEQPSRLMSPVDLAKKSRNGKYCSIALAIASLIVLVTILAIAGLALHMGILYTDTTNPLITFSCTARILKGDRFVGPLQDKARRYKRQFEALYQRSILGQSFVSCVVDKFGDDAQTVYFKLAFNRKKLTKNPSSVEKAIKDILLTDAISRNSVFKNVRFDPKHVTVSQILENNFYQASSYSSNPSEKKQYTPTPSSGGVIRKLLNKSTNANAKKSSPPVSIGRNNDDIGPGVHGSFKISKTDADITEKKSESVPNRSHSIDKSTSHSNKKKLMNETSITSTLYKVSEKVTKSEPSTSSTTPVSSTTKSTTITTKQEITTPEYVPTAPVFVKNPFDTEPWIPIINHHLFLNPFTQSASPRTEREPIYTSFTNPSLSSHFSNDKRLGPINFRGHPLPVNKIPITEATIPGTLDSKLSNDYGTSELEGHVDENNNSKFIEIETLEHIPQRNRPELVPEETVVPEVTETTVDHSKSSVAEEPVISGQGQVEVVIDDSYDLLHTPHTTKIPLVTLLPVKSNSGIGRPMRRRPNEMYKLQKSDEHRTFSGSSEVITSSEDEEVSSKVDFSNRDLKIFGVLNFAPEKTDEDEEQSSRSPKMDLDLMPKNFSDTFLSSKRNYNSTYLNLLTAEEMKQLAQISKVSDKITPLDGSVGDISFSTKAVSSSSSVNQLTIPLLKKPLNFTNVTLVSDASFEDIECTNTSIVCGDGKCFPATARCNQLIDCKDGKDEENCTCSDYLKSHFLLGKICDGLVDCWDYTDESQCEWCNKDQYVCSNSKECIDQEKICDGIKDCPQGDDESKCVTITSDVKSAQEFEYHSEGFLMVRKYGVWGKLCVDNFENISMQTHLSWQMSDLGKAVCQSMTYQGMDSINIVHDEGKDIKYFELAYFSHNRSKSNLSFRETTCNNKRTVKVKCETLECGARPQILKHIARVVGGNNAGLGAWPWQAALYKEGEFQCGATLLSNRWLVSAGHCFYHSLRDHWVARLGALRRGTALPSPYEQLKTVMNIFVHPGYVDSGYINDISLLQLESPVAFSDYVRPVCLPAAHQLPLDGTLCTIIGWGQLFEVGRIFPDTLQEVQVPIISTAECRKRTLFLPLYKITDDMFCAGYDRGGRDACLGDSGGPLMCPESNGKWTLQGITSNGYGCARANRPGVYTKVANYVDWIQSTINNETNVLNKTRKRSCSGHRCPLGECLSQNRLCNGFIECSDGSDEKNCKNGKKMI